MAKYIGIFATACLTRRQLQDLVSHLSQQGEVYCEKAFAGLIDGVLVCLFNAPNREALDAFCRGTGWWRNTSGELTWKAGTANSFPCEWEKGLDKK